jgi:hypothetical protein
VAAQLAKLSNGKLIIVHVMAPPLPNSLLDFIASVIAISNSSLMRRVAERASL